MTITIHGTFSLLSLSSSFPSYGCQLLQFPHVIQTISHTYHHALSTIQQHSYHPSSKTQHRRYDTANIGSTDGNSSTRMRRGRRSGGRNVRRSCRSTRICACHRRNRGSGRGSQGSSDARLRNISQNPIYRSQGHERGALTTEPPRDQQRRGRKR